MKERKCPLNYLICDNACVFYNNYLTKCCFKRCCKNCYYCYWELDAAGDDVEYRCKKYLFPKEVNPNFVCGAWSIKRKEDR